MLVMFDVTNPVGREDAMTKKQGRPELVDVKALMGGMGLPALDGAGDRAGDAGSGDECGARRREGERTGERLGYRAGYYSRSLITRVGTLELRVPQDRQGRFSTELFERYQRSEKALVAALAEMYVAGVSTRKIKAVTEELCGHAFSASAISAIVKRLDDELTAFATAGWRRPSPI